MWIGESVCGHSTRYLIENLVPIAVVAATSSRQKKMDGSNLIRKRKIPPKLRRIEPNRAEYYILTSSHSIYFAPLFFALPFKDFRDENINTKSVFVPSLSFIPLLLLFRICELWIWDIITSLCSPTYIFWRRSVIFNLKRYLPHSVEERQARTVE